MKIKTRLILFLYLLIANCFLAQIPSYVPTSGLIGYFGFNGNATDAITGTTPTSNTAVLTTDRFGNSNAAYRFNGGQVIKYGSSHPFGLLGNSVQVFTINLWINGTDPNSNGMLLGSFGWGYFVRVFYNKVGIECVYTGGTTVWTTAYSNSNVHTGCWKMVTISKNGATVKVYLDGVLNNTVTLQYPLSSFSSTNNWFGANGQDNNSYYNGKIDDCGVWNRELSQSEITQLFQNYTVPITNYTLTASNTGCGQIPNLDAGSGFLTYNWNTGATTQTISASSNGTYTCTVTDNSCTYVASKQVTLINASVSSSSNNICKNEQVTLTANGGGGICNSSELPGTLSTGLVGYWPFCGNANDASGNGNNGTVNGATLTTDRFGNANSAYSFDGVNDFIQCSQSGNSGNPNSTVSFWIKSSTNNSGHIFSYGGNGNSGGDHRILINAYGSCSNSIAFDTYDSGLAFNTSFQGLWDFYVVIYNGLNGNNISSASIYKNGILMSTNCFYVNSVTTNILSLYPITFGRYHGTIPTDYLNATLDEIGFWNRALNQQEIDQLYNLGNSTYSWYNGAITQDISVSPTQTSTYNVAVTNQGSTCNTAITINVVDTLTWTGQVDTDWHKPCNWSPEFVPRCCNSVKIPLTSQQPIVSGVAAAKDVTILATSGALLTVNNGANLQIQDCPLTTTQNTCPTLAVLTTTAVNSITQTTAVSGGNISYQGSSAVTARGICWSTSPNPTTANSVATSGSGTGTFTTNLTGLTAGTTYFVRAYATNGSGTSYGNQVSFVSTTPQPTYPIGSVFCTGSPTAIIDVTNPVTGKTWMDRNLGASQVATQTIDAAAYGDLYQWGRGNDGHQCRNSTVWSSTSSTDQPGHGNFLFLSSALYYDWRNPQNPNLWQGVNGINNPCPSGYRLPTNSEQASERISWGTFNNSSGAFSSPLKLTMAGGRGSSLFDVGSRGYYWSSTTIGTYSAILYFYSSSANEQTQNRFSGFSVRCIKN